MSHDYDDEREMDQRWEAHQERLAQEADEREALAAEVAATATHQPHKDDPYVCSRCGLLLATVVGQECDPPEVTRDNQRSQEIYVVDGGPVFYCVDGTGRWFYDTEEEALADVGVDTKVNYVDSVDE